MTNIIPEVLVNCRRCEVGFALPADHEDVAHPFPGPICWLCEQEEAEEESLMDPEDDD